MKTITITSLFLLLLLTSPGMLQARETKRTSAFDIVAAAYRGKFKQWGIPAYARLDQAYRGKQITASDLVEAAVEANQLSPDALGDEAYIDAVDTNLYGLVTR